ncbi:MAG: branched-chain amino acid transaminase [Myxococcota bacterium]
MIQKSSKIWMDGRLIPWDEARVHVLTHSLHYGLGAFEGIRCYSRADGRSSIFRLREHVQRLFDTCKILTIHIPFPAEAIREACVEVLRANGLAEAYLRPIVFLGDESLGVGASDMSVRVAIAAFHWGAYLGEEGLRRGVRCKISSFQRHHVNVGMTMGKVTGQYFNAILAKREAAALRYDEAIMLDIHGYVAEASGQNIFIVRNGVIRTPPASASILPGVTRDSIIRIAGDLGYRVQEVPFTRDELYIADEAFLTGTASEVTPIREVDDRPMGAGEPGEVTRTLKEAYAEIVKGRSVRYPEWLSFV